MADTKRESVQSVVAPTQFVCPHCDKTISMIIQAMILGVPHE